MATGLLIRDFFKEYRDLRYSNSGSISISNIEHNAYRLSLTLEITHIDAPRYGSLKTLPENTHYGYVTLFRGSTVTDTIAIKYPKFRVFDINNQGVWNYHQASEMLALNDDGLAQALKYYLTETLQEVASDFLPAGILRNLLNDPVTSARGIAWGTEMLARAESVGEQIEDTPNNYRAYPIATPFPDIAKFKADVPCSFLWRLESWYLVNPAVYIVDNPTDTSDATDGEDEYPVPEQGDGDGDGNEFPPSNAADPDADPRDYGGGYGASAPGVTNVFVDLTAYVNPEVNTLTTTFREFLFQVPGQMQPSEVAYNCNASTPSNRPTGAKCFDQTFSARGQSKNVAVTLESYNVVCFYFPNG